MEYKIAAASSIEKLSKLVNELIAEGWEPSGGICYSLGTWNAKLLQPMIRRKQ
ncbi:MAG: DUF1737 domain-containing protein [Opitutales bacterium]|nr:DUF1737 domain-containing protein [Opitutales bacterium]